MFYDLCGGFTKVVILTISSDEEDEENEAQFVSEYFKELIEGGACIMQHDGSLRSAREVLNHLIQVSTPGPSTNGWSEDDQEES